MTLPALHFISFVEISNELIMICVRLYCELWTYLILAQYLKISNTVLARCAHRKRRGGAERSEKNYR